MALIIYDHGYRIQTPAQSLYPPKTVGQPTASKAAHESAGEEDKVHADGEQFEQYLRLNPDASGQKRKPAADTYSANAEQSLHNADEKRRLTMAHIMASPVRTITPATTVNDAFNLMEQLEISHLIVVNAEGNPLGVVSESDLLRFGIYRQGEIDTLYNRQLIAAAPETLVREAAQIFIEHSINAMPVVDKEDNVVGIVCRTDLLRLLITGPYFESWA